MVSNNLTCRKALAVEMEDAVLCISMWGILA